MLGRSDRIRWHKTPAYIEPDERRERYEARLALEWCRANGNPHLTAPSTPR